VTYFNVLSEHLLEETVTDYDKHQDNRGAEIGIRDLPNRTRECYSLFRLWHSVSVYLATLYLPNG